MGKPEKPFPVKLFVAVLAGDFEIMEEVVRELKDAFGEMDYESSPVPFDVTDYYEEELGKDLKRIFFSFKALVLPEELPSVKGKTDEIEEKFCVEGNRKVNIDPGYLDYHKVVLASNKYGGQKIHLAGGVWADMTLHYSKGNFHPFEWSFPDFKTGRYGKIFMEIRTRYKKADRTRP